MNLLTKEKAWRLVPRAPEVSSASDETRREAKHSTTKPVRPALITAIDRASSCCMCGWSVGVGTWEARHGYLSFGVMYGTTSLPIHAGKSSVC